MGISLHNHSRYSDGSGTIEEIIAVARTKNLAIIGISDHFLLSPRYRRIPGCMSEKQLEGYLEAVNAFKGKPGPEVRAGLEVDFFPETAREIEAAVKSRPFDYLIGSVHIIDDVLIDAAPERLPPGARSLYGLPFEEQKLTLKRYWELILQMAESGLFDIAAHLDLPKKYGLNAAAGFEDEIAAVLKAIKKGRMMVELNTSGWHYPCQEQYPSVAILKQCKKLDIPIIISADAHKPEDIDRDFDKAEALLAPPV